MQHLNGPKPERFDAIEDPLARAEQDRRDVERELVDDPCNEGLAHGIPENDETPAAARVSEAPLPGFEPGFPD